MDDDQARTLHPSLDDLRALLDESVALFGTACEARHEAKIHATRHGYLIYREALIAAAFAAGHAEQAQALVDLNRDYNTAVQRAEQAEAQLAAYQVISTSGSPEPP